MTGGGRRRDIAIAKCAVVDSFLDARANQKETAFPNDEGFSGKSQGNRRWQCGFPVADGAVLPSSGTMQEQLGARHTVRGEGPNREIKETGSDCSRYPPAEFSKDGTSRTCLIL